MYEKAILSAEEIRGIIFTLVDDTMKRGDSGISISFMKDGGIYINVYPIGADDDEEEAV